MATQQAASDDELVHNQTAEDDRAYIDIGGSTLLAVVAAVVVLAVAVIGAFFLMGRDRDDPMATSAVSSASASLAGSNPDQDAANVGKAAQAELSH